MDPLEMLRTANPAPEPPTGHPEPLDDRDPLDDRGREDLRTILSANVPPSRDDPASPVTSAPSRASGRSGLRRRFVIPAAAACVAVLAAGGVYGASVLADRASHAGHPTVAAGQLVHDGKPVWTYSGMVIDRPPAGPVRCTGAVLESYPPQCGGLSILGWDWAALPDVEPVSGVRWTLAKVVGTYEPGATQTSGTFTLVRPPVLVESVRRDDVFPALVTSCPAPAGGWRVVDPAKAKQRNLDATIAAAERLPGSGGTWVDWRGKAVGYVLNVRVAGDTAAAERVLRPLWGGGLCVDRANRSVAQLRAIREQIAEDLPNASLGVGYDEVSVGVVADESGALQTRLDERYGAGVVRVRSVLKPYRP